MKYRISSRSGAVLTMAVFASAAAMLSAAILFGYISSITERQEVREELAQASLTQKSALEKYVNMQRNDELGPGEEPPRFILGGYSTEIRLLEKEYISDVKMSYVIPELTDVSAVGTTGGMMVAGIADNILYSCFFASGETEVSQTFSIEISEAPDSWEVYGNTGGEYEAVLICRYDERDSLFLIDRNGTLLRNSIPSGIWSENCVLTSGIIDEEQEIVIAEFTGAGYAVFPESGKVLTLTSPEGTCPVIMPNGKLYGDVSSGVRVSAGTSDTVLLDYFTGDFDLNGEDDLAWIYEDGMTCYLAGREVLQHDRAGGSELAGWGYIEGRYGLGGLWCNSNGMYSWRKLFWNGFAPLPAAGQLLSGHEGRIFGWNDVYFSSGADDSVMYAENDQRSEFTGIIGDYNLSGRADIAVLHDDRLDIQAEPGGRDARKVLIEVRTGIPGCEPVLIDEYEFCIYPTTGRTNIVASGGSSIR